ncbi:MAG: DUF4932 domain-containing protein [Phycisphaerales bacterium]|nr:MAG: DUF4932 domain-containing protein [Phycisphaerales bacterium]
MSIIFRLAGNPEYGRGRVEAYTRDVETQFRPHADHAVVKFGQRLRREHGVSFDAVMGMAVHLDDALTPGERVPFDAPYCRLDKRWPVADAHRFLTLAADFVKETKFADFIKDHQPLYDLTQERVSALLEKEAHLDWFEAFFGARPTARFVLVPGLLNGGGNYGPSFVNAQGEEELYCVLGVWQVDKSGKPGFDRTIVPTIVHEFTHSYTNRLVDKFQDKLRASGEAIYPHVEVQMREQAYGNWKTMVYESLVRACGARYALKYGGDAEYQKTLAYEEERAFIWTAGLAHLLGEYEADRSKWPTLEAFMPRIVTWFDDYAASGLAQRYGQQRAAEAKEKAERSAHAPRLVSIVPADGATGVDPDTSSIVITFDRPMADQSWSIVGGGPLFPEILGQPSYDEARRVLTVRVRLKPNWHYEFGLNSQRFTAFRSTEGVPLEPVWIQFDTGE